MGEDAGTRRIAVWDWPVRLVHWALVLLLPLMWLTYREGEMERHVQLGCLILALLVFRLLWGLVGSDTARFQSFVKGPGAILRYLRHGHWSGVGHNPLGALSVLALLGLLLAQLALGLVSTDTDGLFSGPLSHLVSYETSEWARETHELGFNLLLGLVGLHLLAILVHRLVKKDDLVRPMLTGTKDVATDVTAPRMTAGWVGVLLLLVALGLGWWVHAGAPLPR